MSEYMKVTIKKARSRVILLRRIRPVIDADTACMIFKTMNLPKLTYCPYSTFGDIPNYVENKVQYIENRAQKIIGKPLPYSIKNFQKRRIATYVHQCLTNNVSKNFENYFEVIESKKNTRNSGTLVRLPKVKLEVTRKHVLISLFLAALLFLSFLFLKIISILSFTGFPGQQCIYRM